MKEIIIKNPKVSKSGISAIFRYKNRNWGIKFEVLASYNIKTIKELEGVTVWLNGLDVATIRNWSFIKEENILSIIKNENELRKDEKVIQNEISEIIKAEVEIENNEESLTENFFTDEEDELEEKSESLEIDFESIYANIEMHKRQILNKKITSIDKLIEKSIKLTPRKYNNGVVRKDDYTYDDLYKLIGNDLVPFLIGKTNELTIRYPRKIKIPKEYKNDKKAILNFLDERKYLSFARKVFINNYKNDLISSAELLNEIESNLSSKFAKIKDMVRKATKLKYETGFNPFVIAWPYVVGKTKSGTFIHAPICYQEIEIKDLEKIKNFKSDFTLSKTGHFNINTYPILKNYTEEDISVNEIKRFSNSLSDILIEYFKHGIKIDKPKTNEFSNYKRIRNKDDKTKQYRKFYFELSNEVLLKFKPNDELIHSDLRLIRKKYADFSIPKKNISLNISTMKKLDKKRHIFSLDDSKTYAVKKALEDSMVIWGPPGTGKSQAISALVGEFIRENKSSLIVAEKAAAIDVIESNLKKIGLDSFVLNINNISKLEFQRKFEKQLNLLLLKPIQINDEKVSYSKMWLNKYKYLNDFYGRNSQEKIKAIFASLLTMNKILEYKKDLKTAGKVVSFYEDLKFHFNLSNDLEKIASEKQIKIKQINEIEQKILNLERKEQENENLTIDKLEEDNTVLIFGLNNLIDKKVWIEKIHSAKTTNEVYNVIVGNLENLSKKAGFFESRKINSNVYGLRRIHSVVKEFKKFQLVANNKISELNKEKEKLNKDVEILIEKINSIDNNKAKMYQKITSEVTENQILKIKSLEIELDEVIHLKELIMNKHWNWEEHKKEIEEHIKIVRKFIVYKAQMNFLRECENLEFSRNILKLKGLINGRLHRRKNTIEMLVATFAKYFKKIFAALMMAPEQVSLIFSIAENQFDYAVFDEASQIRLHKALPSIHRSAKIIVAGDEKQLGPTDLFTDISEEDELEMTIEEKEGEDLEEKTLLDFAKRNYLNVPLITHYRSRSKKLIEFSNNNFYKTAGIELDAVDSPLSRFDGRNAIIVEEIDGEWQEEAEIVDEIFLEKRTNIKEAKRVVALFSEYYHANNKLSIGIITFNDQQKKLIEKMLNKEFENNIEIMKMINEPSKFFIKSIKEVQGDERDVVIFSIAYGRRKGKKGYVRGFGYFSKEKINVAITRAKLRMHILKSLPSSEVSANNEDYQVFKKWLHYLETEIEKEDILLQYKNKFYSSFEKEFCKMLAKALNNKYQLIANYPVGKNEIDIVIWDKTKKVFVCAIEIDGAKFYDSEEKLEANYNRKILLENMGWEFIVVPTLKFHLEPTKTINWTISKIEKILRN